MDNPLVIPSQLIGVLLLVWHLTNNDKNFSITHSYKSSLHGCLRFQSLFFCTSSSLLSSGSNFFCISLFMRNRPFATVGHVTDNF